MDCNNCGQKIHFNKGMGMKWVHSRNHRLLCFEDGRDDRAWPMGPKSRERLPATRWGQES